MPPFNSSQAFSLIMFSQFTCVQAELFIQNMLISACSDKLRIDLLMKLQKHLILQSVVGVMTGKTPAAEVQHIKTQGITGL